ncbi:MAG: hypothetical protein EOT05_01360 [Candidatus Microsaccharimonas sossegonensis]|uniref:Uncharacterized protein n=1 Tax=Candidatus Microsaccharimonas sossegonensis TaxID=2506948 RepID=A0A4Q0AGW0_9BACT|nr:MAG: hypothetical protein EOT05_01360 [Candidatus Microsaccharimonas sossegonensis]
MKKRGIFWIIAPPGLVVVGVIVWVLNSIIDPSSGIGVVLNLIAFLFMGFGVLAFIPGLIYGVILLSKK